MKHLSPEEELEAARRLLASYQDLAVEQEDDDAFVARGNGFCDRKYSEDFIAMQVAHITARVADLERKIHDNNNNPTL